jgi:alpha-L-rhamnosidase
VAEPTVRVEHLQDALGIGVSAPRLSWWLPAGATRQEAYEIGLDDGTSTGRVESEHNVLVAWPGRPLESRERREVRVRVWTDLGSSAWSAPVPVEAGLLASSAWSAEWVAPTEGPTTPGFRPAHVLQGSFVVASPVSRARLYATAQGIYEASLNGERVGDLELAPGFTEYAHRIQVQTYDVTELVRAGRNELSVELADGWFRGSVGVMRATNQWGDRTAFLAQLHVDHPDGSTTVLGTDGTWRRGPSRITAADLIEGQTEDHRLSVTADQPVEVLELGHDHLVASPAPPVRAVQTLVPHAITRLEAGRTVVDLGQNVNGHVRVSHLGPAGTEIRLVHGESIDAEGDVTTDHLVPDVPFISHEVRAGMVDGIVASGEPGEVFDPRFTTHGFRYVRLEGAPDDVEVTGVVVHTDLRRTGAFTCSDPVLNALHDAAEWSFRDNACDIPTDNPTRERAGWTGDWQLFVPVASFLYDVAGFSAKWLRDVAVGQFDNGVLGNMAPMPPAERTGFMEKLNGSAGWGDASVLVPWELYQEYGDLDLLAEHWPMMTRWLDHASSSAASGRHPDRAAARPTPLPHEEYLWDTGFHWGEWLVPGEDPSDFAAFMSADKSDTATAYLAHTARTAARIASLLGRSEEASRYASLADSAAAAWRAEFLASDGTVSLATQANCVRALAFDLVPASGRQVVADQLANLVRANNNRLATGFLATPLLLPVLAEQGHLDVAYDLLLQDQPPSWLAMLARGATTVWERWEGVDDDGVPHESLNHYSKGAVVGFLHRHVAGLRRTSSTWRTFDVQPLPGGRLTWASAWHDTPHGRASVDWVLEGGALSVSVTVPPGCTATVRLPDAAAVEVGPGDHKLDA